MKPGETDFFEDVISRDLRTISEKSWQNRQKYTKILLKSPKLLIQSLNCNKYYIFKKLSLLLLE